MTFDITDKAAIARMAAYVGGLRGESRREYAREYFKHLLDLGDCPRVSSFGLSLGEAEMTAWALRMMAGTIGGASAGSPGSPPDGRDSRIPARIAGGVSANSEGDSA